MKILSKKERHFDIRLSQADKAELEKKAKNTGLTESAYIRALINNEYPISREDYQNIKNLVNEINSIGNNINQIAKKFNMGMFSEYDKKHLIDLMNTLVKNTEEIINQKNEYMKGRK